MVVQINMLIALGRTVGIHVTHAHQFIGETWRCSDSVVQRAKTKFNIDGGQRQPLLYPTKGIQSYLRFIG